MSVCCLNIFFPASPYLGDSGQYCGKIAPKLPPTSGNRAFVKYKVGIPLFNSFKLRYYEVQHSCGGQIRLTNANSSVIVNTPNYPNIPSPHISCEWTVLAPIGERIRVDFIDRFDLTASKDCSKEYVELRDGSTSASPIIGTFCIEKPTTKKSRSNVLMMKFFTDVAEPKNGFKVNISIEVCGGTMRSNVGFITSKNYPGLGAYPSNAQCDYRITGYPNHIFNITLIDIDLPESSDENNECDRTKDHIVIYSVIPDFNVTGSDSMIELTTLCGGYSNTSSFLSDTNEVLVKFKTFEKSKDLFKGFKLLYNASHLSCGGSIDGESGIITSPGYPTKTLNKLLCEWKITVPKGRRVKVEFLDIDLLQSNSQFLQRIGVYNDFRYSNRLLFVTSNSSTIQPIFSSDNKMMITMWVRIASSNRGFKMKFSSDTQSVCEGTLNAETGRILPPSSDLNLASYSCDYIRELEPIYGDNLSQGTIAYYFSDISVGKKISNCRYASTVINVLRRSGETDEDMYLARICGNTTTTMTVLSPFPDVKIEVRQNLFFGQINFTMEYKTHKCGGIFVTGGTFNLRNLPANTSNDDVLDCAWYFKYEEGFSVSISIINLKMKLSCDEEYVVIYNGPSALSPSIGKFCGTEFSKEIMVSQKNTVFVEYHTSNFVGSSKDSAFEIKFDSASFGCGGILNKNNFKFKTPLYDKPYPPNTECIWEIRAESGYHIGLTFVDRFFIEDSLNCIKDSVEVFDFVNDDWKSLGKRCGREVPRPFNSTSDKMRIIFRSDETSNGDGFSAVWTQNCGGVYKVDQTPRILSSPGYPKLYGPQLLCNYTFVAPEKGFIVMNFLAFSIETTGSKCMYDNVTIYKVPDYVYTPNYEMEKVGVFCGVISPGRLRHKEKMNVIFQSDRWVERTGFEIEYKLEDCGGVITNSTMISSPVDISSSSSFLGTMHCTWNISAPADKKIVIKFENFAMDTSYYCSFDYVDIFNGTVDEDKFRLAKLCGNLTNTIKPIVINNNRAIVKLKTDQQSSFIGFSAAIYFRPKCDQTIILSNNSASFTLDRTNGNYSEGMECVYRVIGETLSTIKVEFSEMHLSPCDPDKGGDKCNCDYLEVHDGNGPFSEVIGRYCGHDLPNDIISSGSALYILFVTDSIRQSTGFRTKFTQIPSLCSSQTYQNFTGNETEPTGLRSPMKPGTDKYAPNIRCTWTADAPYGKIFDIRFEKFELEDSPFCANDSLTIEDDNIKEYITEGLGEEVIFRGKSSTSLQPSFYSGITGPTAPHVYCGSTLPHEYVSESKKIRITFKSNSEREFAGFKLAIKTMESCARNYTALTGRLVSTSEVDDCNTTIKVSQNYTIALYFNRFFFYEQDCTKAFLKIYDGDFDSGTLVKTLCGYTMPDPIFSTTNQLSLNFHFAPGLQSYLRGNYDMMYVATNQGRGCGGVIYNYGGVFTSPLYPNK